MRTGVCKRMRLVAVGKENAPPCKFLPCGSKRPDVRAAVDKLELVA